MKLDEVDALNEEKEKTFQIIPHGIHSKVYGITYGRLMIKDKIECESLDRIFY